LNYRTNLTSALSLEALAGYEYFKTNFNGGVVTAFGFNTNLNQATRIGIPYTNIFQNAQTQSPYFSFANPTAELQSYFGRVSLNYKDKLFSQEQCVLMDQANSVKITATVTSLLQV
jgi:hypothetical protein